MRLGFALASFSLGSAAVFAGVGTSSFTAQVSINANCTISASSVAFGQYDPIVANKAHDLHATGSITITCVKGTAPTVALGLGNNAAGGKRRMRHVSGGFLTYELYQPASRIPGAPCSFPGMTVWGASGANLFAAANAPSKHARTFNVCGTVPAGQHPRVGQYADTVVATVNF